MSVLTTCTAALWLASVPPSYSANMQETSRASESEREFDVCSEDKFEVQQWSNVKVLQTALQSYCRDVFI